MFAAWIRTNIVQMWTNCTLWYLLFCKLLFVSWQDSLEDLEKKKKETENALKQLGKDVQDLEPKHKELKKVKEDQKKQWRAVTVSTSVLTFLANYSKRLR